MQHATSWSERGLNLWHPATHVLRRSHGPWRSAGVKRQQGGVVAGVDVMEGVAVEAADEAVEGGPQTVDEAVEGGQGRDGGVGDARPAIHEIVTGPVVPRTDIDLDSTRCATELTIRLQSCLGTRGSGGTRTTGAREVATAGCGPQRGRGGGVSTSSLDHILRAETRVVHEQTPRKRGVPLPRPVPAEGGVALGESSGAEGLGMPRGSHRQDTVAQASTRVVPVRKGGSPVTIEEDDPETTPAVQEEDKDYEGEEESEKADNESDHSGDDENDEPPPPPPTHASRRPAAQTSSSSRGKRRPTSDTRGGTRSRRTQSGKGKRGRWS
ncbi:hypothetical protein CBR_g25918 [Chara braunii]|uniref:Uncharacterized protein n=1 Tax=Chara braunii TaxID=69332 RepID=A0A388L6Q9_CHABU|nr:hypothetical protein CBR_g25918 [Chara braunii]|eukprot:GBG77985.1 hypothetical protein CBR_g25918 [Chara braunii]